MNASMRGRLGRLLATFQPTRWISFARWCAALLLLNTAGMLMAAVRLTPVTAIPVQQDLTAEALLRLSADPFPGSP